MSWLNGKSERAKSALESYLSLESPEMRSKVYEIINLSGLEADDPMFLVLALTGQMRVFLEAAPEELGQLLSEWKRESANSLSEVMSAIALVKDMQQVQASALQSSLSEVSQRCVFEIKEAGMVTVGAIADANSETLEQNRNLQEKIVAVEAQVEAGRKHSAEIMKALIDRLKSETDRCRKVQSQMNSSYSAIKSLQQKTLWLKWAEWLTPLLALVIVSGFSFSAGGWLVYQKYNTPNQEFGRKIMSWNNSRIFHCQETNNPKCTFWIVPPEQRE